MNSLFDNLVKYLVFNAFLELDYSLEAKTTLFGFQDQSSLNAGQKYCRMLQINQRGITQKLRKGKQSFSCETHCLDLIHNSINLNEDIS